MTTQSLNHHTASGWSPGTTLLLGPSGSERPALPHGAIVTTGPKMLLLTTSGSVFVKLLGTVSKSVAHITTEALANHML